MVELGGGGLEARGGGCLIGLAHSSCQRHALFSKGLWEESNRATSGASCWMAGGVDSGPGKKPRGCMHGAPTATQVLTHPLNPLLTNARD